MLLHRSMPWIYEIQSEFFMNDDKEISDEAKAAIVRELYDAADKWAATLEPQSSRAVSVAMFKEEIARQCGGLDKDFLSRLNGAADYLYQKISASENNDDIS